MRKIINHHIEGGTRESHPRVQNWQHPRLGRPRIGLQILNTRMGFPHPSLNVVLDSISPFQCIRNISVPMGKLQKKCEREAVSGVFFVFVLHSN